MNSTAVNSAFYTGTVRHRRFTPVPHSFKYTLSLFYIDLDEIPDLFNSRRFWSDKGFNLGQLKREDYMAPHHVPIKQAVLDKIQEQGLDIAGIGKVCMLSNLRIWGVCFNPVTLYYVSDTTDKLIYIVAEVNNTPWLERHAYILPVTEQGRRQQFRYRFDKSFHVSPFNPMAMCYQWLSTRPTDKLLVHMENHEEAAKHMDATLYLKRQPWSGQRLNSQLYKGPWRTLWIPVAIYWQALKLWLKGAPVYNHPKPESDRISKKPCEDQP